MLDMYCAISWWSFSWGTQIMYASDIVGSHIIPLYLCNIIRCSTIAVFCSDIGSFSHQPLAALHLTTRYNRDCENNNYEWPLVWLYTLHVHGHGHVHHRYTSWQLHGEEFVCQLCDSWSHISLTGAPVIKGTLVLADTFNTQVVQVHAVMCVPWGTLDCHT